MPDAQVRIIVEHLSGNKNELVINTISNEYVYNTIEKVDNVEYYISKSIDISGGVKISCYGAVNK